MQTTEAALTEQERKPNHKVKLALILDRTPYTQKGGKHARELTRQRVQKRTVPERTGALVMVGW